MDFRGEEDFNPIEFDRVKKQGVEFDPQRKERRRISMAKMTVQDTSITVLSIDNKDYISLTDIAKFKTDDPFIAICNWMRNRNTIEYLGIWESLYNPNFNPIEFDRFRMESGLNAFTMSPKKWIETTNAIGIISINSY